MRYQVNIELIEVGDGGKMRLIESHLVVDLTDKGKAWKAYRGTVDLVEGWLALAAARMFG